MKLYSALALVSFTFISLSVHAQDLATVRKMEASGDAASARAALLHAVESNPHSVPALTNYAEFLERYGDPAAKEAYTKLLAALKQYGDSAHAASVQKRLALVDVMAGQEGRPAGSSVPNSSAVSIPGPLRSFARMVAI